MKPFLYETTFDQLELDLQNAIEFLKKFEMEINTTRIHKYKKDLEEFINVYRSEDFDKLKDPKFQQRMADSLIESSEWIRIAKGLRDIDDSSLKSKLKRFIKGPQITVNENMKSNLARNIGFELLLASHFHVAGYEIDLSGDCDIIVKDNSKWIFIECKRPSSKNKLKKRVKEAYNQLSERFKVTNENPYGIIAISIGKTLNPDQKIIIAKDKNELDKIMQYNLLRFFKNIKPVYDGFINNKVIGIFGLLSVPTIIVNYGGLINSNLFGAVPLLPKGYSDDIYFRDICKKLHFSLPKLNE